MTQETFSEIAALVVWVAVVVFMVTVLILDAAYGAVPEWWCASPWWC